MKYSALLILLFATTSSATTINYNITGGTFAHYYHQNDYILGIFDATGTATYNSDTNTFSFQANLSKDVNTESFSGKLPWFDSEPTYIQEAILQEPDSSKSGIISYVPYAFENYLETGNEKIISKYSLPNYFNVNSDFSLINYLFVSSDYYQGYTLELGSNFCFREVTTPEGPTLLLSLIALVMGTLRSREAYDHDETIF